MVKRKSPSEGQGPVRRRLPAGERRRQILERALPLFARQGYEGTGTRELAAAAGVTEPVLYRHFENKAALFQAAVVAAGARLCEAVAERMQGTDTPGERVRALADQLPAFLAAHDEPISILLHASLSGDPQILATGGTVAQEIGGLLSGAFEDSGLHDDVAPEIAGFALFQIGMGASVLRRMPVPTMDAPDYSARVVAMLLGGMRP